MRMRALRACRWPSTMALAAAGLWLMLAGAGSAQTAGSAGGGDLGLPATTIAPAEGEPEETPPPATTTPHRVKPPPTAHHAPASTAKSVPAEPAQAKLLLKVDTWIY